MRLKFTYLLPVIYVLLGILALALGPLGIFIFYLKKL